MRPALLGDLAVAGRQAAGLLDPWVQPEIADQLLRTTEAAKVADRGDQRQRDGRVHAGDGHQPQHLFALQSSAPQGGVDDPQLLVVKVDLAQQGVDRELLVGGQVLIGQPAAALDPEQVGCRAAWDQVAVKDRLHLVLQPRALPDDARPSGDLATQRVGGLISDPHRRQEVRGEQFGEDRGVDLVGLDLRFGDRAGLLRIGHHHPGDVWLDQPHDRVRVARRLDRHLILGAKAVAEHAQRLGGQADLPGLTNPGVLPHRDLRELAVNIHSDTPAAHHNLPAFGLTSWEARRANDTYGFALEAHPGKSRGRPTTNTRSRRNV